MEDGSKVPWLIQFASPDVTFLVAIRPAIETQERYRTSLMHHDAAVILERNSDNEFARHRQVP